MERSNFFNDQHVLSDDLNTIESTKIDSIKKHTLALISSGSVIGRPGDGYLLPSITNIGPSIITIAAGSAVDNFGEIITLAVPEVVSRISLASNQTWASGPAGTFYIKLQYQEASGSFKSNDAGVSYPTRYTDSYAVVINNAVPSSASVCLGSFVADSSGEITGGYSGLTDLRVFIRAKAFDDRTYLSASPIVGHIVVKDHILAKGSGTQTNTNPHGITLGDLGYPDTSIGLHWQDAHTNGIMLLARDTSTLNSWSGSIINTTIDYLIFTPPTAYAVMNISGGLFSGSIAPLLATSAPSDGVFWVVTTGGGTAQFLPTGSYSFDPLNPHKYPAYVKLGSASISNTGADIDYYTNIRDMFAMSQVDIRADFVEASSDPALPLSESATLVDNLNRIRARIPFTTMRANLFTPDGPWDFNTLYRNSGSVPLFVQVSFSGTGQAAFCAHSGSYDPTTSIHQRSECEVSSTIGSVYGIVPPSWYYSVYDAIYGLTGRRWTETY